ncbi:sulfatase-like hydrolase/transferase, partial [bacterium]|nr:sulfatase-like hydrolase/transferase [bacterium]
PTFPPAAGRKTPNKFSGAKKAHEIYHDERTAELLVEKSVKWIGENKEKPFFLYLPTTNIHHPFTPSPRFKGTSECGLYGDFIQELDWMVGEVLKSLEDNGVADNTLVIFTSDNGGMFNTGGQDAFKDGHKQNGDLLGFKFGIWEGGHRIPFIAKWPGKIAPNTTSDQLICNVDMLASFGALTEQTVEKKQLADSVNILPALLGEPKSALRDHVILSPYRATHLSIRKGKWMYIDARNSGGFGNPKPGTHTFSGAAAAAFIGSVNSDFTAKGRIKKDAPPGQLYDLEADVNQTTNVYRQHPKVVAELKALLKPYSPAKKPGKRPGKAQPRPKSRKSPTEKSAS